MSQRQILQGLSAERVQRLETLVELKKLYRNIIRAEALLALPSPVYTAPEGAAWHRTAQHATAGRNHPGMLKHILILQLQLDSK
jgi:hypothetical protein